MHESALQWLRTAFLAVLTLAMLLLAMGVWAVAKQLQGVQDLWLIQLHQARASGKRLGHQAYAYLWELCTSLSLSRRILLDRPEAWPRPTIQRAGSQVLSQCPTANCKLLNCQLQTAGPQQAAEAVDACSTSPVVAAHQVFSEVNHAIGDAISGVINSALSTSGRANTSQVTDDV